MVQSLVGTKVIDLTSNVAGPSATGILAALGATVIKIETMAGDDSRRWAPMTGDISVAFDTFNRGKQSVVLDLKSEDGQRSLEALLTDADVFVQSMRPSAARRLGIDRESLVERYPHLIYAELSAFGDTPAAENRPGIDPVLQAFSGIMEMNGHEDGPLTRCAPSLVDAAGGLWLAIGILAALLGREKTSVAESVEVALIDAAMSLVPFQATEALITGRRPQRYGTGNPMAAPLDGFDASDGPIFVGAANQKLWKALLLELGLEELEDDPRFIDQAARVAHRTELVAILQARFATDTVANWITRLIGRGITASEVFGIEQTVRHPLAQERSWFAGDGAYPVMRMPFLLDGAIVAAASSSPHIGEHTEPVLDVPAQAALTSAPEAVADGRRGKLRLQP